MKINYILIALLFLFSCSKDDDCTDQTFRYNLKGQDVTALLMYCTESEAYSLDDKDGEDNAAIVKFLESNHFYFEDDGVTRIDNDLSNIPASLSSCMDEELSVKIELYTRTKSNSVKEKKLITTVEGLDNIFSVDASESLLIDSIAISAKGLKKPYALQFTSKDNSDRVFYVPVTACGEQGHDGFQLYWSEMNRLEGYEGDDINLFNGTIRGDYIENY